MLWWFWPYINMKHPCVYVRLRILIPSHLPPHPIPLGCPRAPALSALLPPPNLHQSSISHVVISMLFSQMIPPSPPPNICVSFATLRIGSSLSSFYIPCICINILYWCFSFCVSSLCIIGSSFIHLLRTDSNVFLFLAE